MNPTDAKFPTPEQVDAMGRAHQRYIWAHLPKPTEEDRETAYRIQHPNALPQEQRIDFPNPYPSLADYLCLLRAWDEARNRPAECELKQASLADMVNTHRERGECAVGCPSMGCTMMRALAIADETVQSVVECNLTPARVGEIVWYDSGSANDVAASAIEEALIYAEQRGILRRLASSPTLVRVVLVEPAYEVRA